MLVVFDLKKMFTHAPVYILRRLDLSNERLFDCQHEFPEHLKVQKKIPFDILILGLNE